MAPEHHGKRGLWDPAHTERSMLRIFPHVCYTRDHYESTSPQVTTNYTDPYIINCLLCAFFNIEGVSTSRAIFIFWLAGVQKSIFCGITLTRNPPFVHFGMFCTELPTYSTSSAFCDGL